MNNPRAKNQLDTKKSVSAGEILVGPVEKGVAIG
jgi:hypothetical protein